jgi:chemotaxis protein histidine kinase CheA
MAGAIAEVRKNISEITKKLLTDIVGIRIGIMAVGDYCDQDSKYVVSSVDLCNDVDKLQQWVTTVSPTSGGDTPEAYEFVLREANKLSWKASNRALVLIGDAYPHVDSYMEPRIYWGDELEALIKNQVKVYGVLAGGSGSNESRDFFTAIAERSNGIFMELRHFGLVEDMFMAVCYKEFSDAGLEAFASVVEGAGKMDEDRSKMFNQLRRGPSSVADAAAAVAKEKPWQWWKKGAAGSPLYKLDEATGRWQTARRTAAAATPKKKPTPKKKAPAAAVAAAAAAASSDSEEEPKKRVAPKRKSATKKKEDEEEEEEEEEEEKPKKRTRASAAAAAAKKKKESSEESSDEDMAKPKVAPKVGGNYYVRGNDEVKPWIARVVKVTSRSIVVSWYEELASYADHYTHLPAWVDDIPQSSILAPARMTQDESTGMFVRTGKMPAI